MAENVIRRKERMSCNSCNVKLFLDKKNTNLATKPTSKLTKRITQAMNPQGTNTQILSQRVSYDTSSSVS